MYTLPQKHAQQYAGLKARKSLSSAKSLSTGIIGSGNSARALAAYLSSQGHSVNLLARSNQKLEFLGSELELKSEGKINGCFKIEGAGCDFSRFSLASEYLFIATITTAYQEIALKLGPYIDPKKHKVILFSSKLGGSLVFAEALRQAGFELPAIIETDALFASRIKETENSVWIRGIKAWTLFSSTTHSQTIKNASELKKFFPDLSPARNIIERGLTDFGAVAHAGIAIANMNLISRKTPFYFYYDGMTEETIKVLEAVECEFARLAYAYGSELISMKDLLNRYYGCDTSSLYAAMTSVPNYRHSMGPDSLQHRFLHEDICSTLVPASSLAKLAGIETPVINGLISIASALTGKDLRSEGRSLALLGLGGMSYKEVFAYVNG